MWQRIKRQARPNQAGQSIVIIAVAFLALMVIIGLAVDLGLMYIERIRIGKACDAAALAAAQDLPFREFAARRAVQYMIENGYDPSNANLELLGLSDTSAQAVRNYFSWTDVDESRGTVVIDFETVNQEEGDGTTKIRVYGRIPVPMNFMKLIGFHNA